VLDSISRISTKYLPFIFVLWLIYSWFSRKNEYKNSVLYSGYSAILALLLNSLISTLYYHPRPFMLNMGKLLIYHAPETSFPSDHTTFMLSIAFMLTYFKETRKSGLALSILGFIGGLSRVFCGLHFPIDIIGSFGVALLSSFLIYSLQTKLKTLNQIIIRLYFKVIKNEKNV
jgi:undecaprenyl-diphosphatase